MAINEYPFESHFAQLGALKYHYIDEGKGVLTLMVHGNPSWSFYYRNLIKKLSPEFRAVAPDHIGCGLSDKPSDKDYSYQFKDRVRDLGQFIDSLNYTGKINIIAHDWGGAIACAWAGTHADRVNSLVMLNTGAFHLPQTKKFPLALKIIRDSKIGAHLVLRHNIFSVGASLVGCKINKMNAELRKLYQLPYDSKANRLATLKFVQDIPLDAKDASFDLISQTEKNLKNLKDKPILLAWGMKDFVFDKYFLSKWIDLFPHAKVLRYENAGHYVLEDIGEPLCQEIFDFLKRQ